MRQEWYEKIWIQEKSTTQRVANPASSITNIQLFFGKSIYKYLLN